MDFITLRAKGRQYPVVTVASPDSALHGDWTNTMLGRTEARYIYFCLASEQSLRPWLLDHRLSFSFLLFFFRAFSFVSFVPRRRGSTFLSTTSVRATPGLRFA